MKSKKEDSILKIHSVIRSGIKIIEVDQEKQEVKFIDCVTKRDGCTKPFFTTIPVEQGVVFEKLLASKPFKDAMFDPKDRGILLIDVAGYSRQDTLYQASILSLFNQAIKHALKGFKAKIGNKCLEQIIPTGDGCYFIFNSCINEYFLKVAYSFFIEMNKVQDLINGKFSRMQSVCEKMYLRAGCLIGETDFFYDPTGRRNCYGTGMNEAERVLKLGQSGIKENKIDCMAYDSFFLDKSLVTQAEELIRILQSKNYNPILTDLGKICDKHDISRNIYWLHELPPIAEIEI